MRDWTDIGFSSIYAILKKLEKQGWVEVETTHSVGQGAARKVYCITRAGYEAQRSAVLDALSTTGRPNSSLLLGLANLPIITRAQAGKALGQYCAALESRLEQLEQRSDEQQPMPDFVRAMFDYSQTMIRSELSWLTAFKLEMEAQHG